jgi:hypothetical protein
MGAELPPIDWTLAHLTGVVAMSGEMVNCPLPGHEDSTPSFNLWDDDDAGVPQRYGCFGCGRRGDVISLIAELEGLDMRAAMVRAAELGEEAQGETFERKPKEKRPQRDLSDAWEVLRAGFGDNEYAIFHEFTTAKGFDSEELEQYVTEEWNWLAGRTDPTKGIAIAMPHFGANGQLTGIKYRAGDKRWAEDGSRFVELYGAWRDKNRKRILLCEGETDTAWAAWSLRDEDIDVLGLPSGVSQQIRDEWREYLKGRELILAFDADPPDKQGRRPGPEATKVWCAAWPDAMVARLPEGEDVRSSNVPVTQLVAKASVPTRSSGVIDVQQGMFVRRVKESWVPISDFAFVPVRELDTEEGPAWEGVLSGRRETVLLRAGDLLSGTTITRWANKNGKSWTGGSGPSVQSVFNHLAAESAFLPLERATTKAGKIGRSFVGPGFCVGPDRVRYIPPAFGDAQLEGRLKVTRGDWDPRVLLALEKMNDPSVMAIVLGWLCSTLLRGQRAPAPPLFVSGESGAGKTSMLSTLLGSFGFRTETNLTTTTPFGVDCMVSSCIGFPVWFDEYRGGARVDSMERLRQLLRDAYYGQPSIKGGMKTQATELSEVTTWAGIIVSGEMSSGETSHRDRIVMLDLDPSGSARGTDAFKWLQTADTRGLGYDLLQFLAARADSLFKVEPHGAPELPSRFRDTLGFIQTGWDAWKEFRWEYGLRDKVEEPDLTMLATGRRESEDPWLEAIKACEGVRDRSGMNDIVEAGDGYVTLIPQEVVVEARRIGIELPARANELVQWLRRRYTVEDTRVGNRRAKRVVGMKL